MAEPRKYKPGQLIAGRKLIALNGGGNWLVECVKCYARTTASLSRLKKMPRRCNSCQKPINRLGVLEPLYGSEWIFGLAQSGLRRSTIARWASEILEEPVTKDIIIGRLWRIGSSKKKQPTSKPRNVIQLPAPGQCSYPIGDPQESGFRYCLTESIDGRDYCAEHDAIVYERKPQREAA